MNRLLGERSRVLRSSSVRVRGRLLSWPRACLLLLLYVSLLLARAGGGLGFAPLPWLLLWWERGDCGGLAYNDGSRDDGSGVTARMVVLLIVPVLVETLVVNAYSSRSTSAVVWLLLRRPLLCRWSMLVFDPDPSVP
jgi:hypothetical protein